MSRYSRRRKLLNTPMAYMFISVFVGLGTILICLFGFATLLSHINAPPALVSVMATVSLCIGGYFGGYLCAKKKRRNGLLQGVICGVVIFMVILVIGSVFAKAALGISAGGKLLLTMLFGAIGGVVGVNTKKRRY